jgi:hypothetical protein
LVCLRDRRHLPAPVTFALLEAREAASWVHMQGRSLRRRAHLSRLEHGIRHPGCTVAVALEQPYAVAVPGAGHAPHVFAAITPTGVMRGLLLKAEADA